MSLKNRKFELSKPTKGHRHLKNHGKSISHQLPPTNHNTDYTSNNYFSNYNTGIGKYDFHPEINRENVNHSNQTSNSGSLSLFGRLVGAHSSTGSSRVFLPGLASGASGGPQYQLESSTLPRNLLMNCGDNNNHSHNHNVKPNHSPTKMHGFNKNFKNKITLSYRSRSYNNAQDANVDISNQMGKYILDNGNIGSNNSNINSIAGSRQNMDMENAGELIKRSTKNRSKNNSRNEINRLSAKNSIPEMTLSNSTQPQQNYEYTASLHRGGYASVKEQSALSHLKQATGKYMKFGANHTLIEQVREREREKERERIDRENFYHSTNSNSNNNSRMHLGLRTTSEQTGRFHHHAAAFNGHQAIDNKNNQRILNESNGALEKNFGSRNFQSYTNSRSNSSKNLNMKLQLKNQSNASHLHNLLSPTKSAGSLHKLISDDREKENIGNNLSLFSSKTSAQNNNNNNSSNSKKNSQTKKSKRPKIKVSLLSSYPSLATSNELNLPSNYRNNESQKHSNGALNKISNMFTQLVPMR